MSPSTPPDSARIASATTFGPQRTRLGRQPLPDPLDQRAAHADHLLSRRAGCAMQHREDASRRRHQRRPSAQPAARRARVRRPARAAAASPRAAAARRSRRRRPRAARPAPGPARPVRRSGLASAQPPTDRRRGRARPNVGWRDQHDEIRRRRARPPTAGVGAARQVADDRRPAAAARIDHRAERAGVDLARRLDPPTARVTPRCDGSASRSAG